MMYTDYYESVPGEKQKVTKLKGSDKILPSLVGVVTIFLVCQIPDMILQILWRVNSPFAPTFSIIAYDFVIINASINFVVYVVAADGFRRSLRVYVLPCLKYGSNSEELSHTGPSLKRAKSSLSNSTDNHHGGGRNWGQSYSNPEPIDETDECSSSEEEIAEEATAQKEKSTTRIWLGGTRKPGKDEVESHIACEPTTVVLPSGVNLGSAGVYTIISDPLIQPSPGKYTHQETRAYITCKTDV
ncbi:hypothetical protein EB796_005566 [Bugula neritina]|uniref:G-protein coupled receptors family 1 profile domain-containing protein n=1 Tax=Bugula neritina TaxID=10212 RepID=A0A7J7KEV0_BUGNE|nr:hypothetical protein EB796_005566 [Bugula neritina]